jgi:arabinofuranosyltransferase
VLLLRGIDRGALSWFWLAFVGSLGVVNRLDTVLFYVPPMLFAMGTRWRELRWGRFLAGYTPIVAWLLFSTFYYGFPYPNTALAKLNEEFPRYILVRQGLFYAFDLVQRDPAGALTLLTGTALTAVHLARACRSATADRWHALGVGCLGLGFLLYGAYVVWIGGSFVSRRHWSVPIVGAAIVLAESLELLARGAQARAGEGAPTCGLWALLRRPSVWAGAVAAGAALFLVYGVAPGIKTGELARSLFPDSTKAERPRAILALPSGRMELTRDLTWVTSPGGIGFIRKGERLRAKGIGSTTTIGLTAIAAGRRTLIIDRYALSDPLLARLPPETFRMAGHFKRHVPDGYLTYRSTGSLDGMDPDLRRYYEPLRLIITGPLFNWKRIQAIWRFNLGAYDHHRDAYVATRLRQKRAAALQGEAVSSP